MRRAALLHRRLTALFQPQKISVDVKTATDTVQLHSLDIKIKDVCAVLADASVVKTAPKGPISLTGAKATVHPCEGVLSFSEVAPRARWQPLLSPL